MRVLTDSVRTPPDLMANWAVLDVSANPANQPSDSSNCHLLPQEAVQDANEALEGDVYFNTTSGSGITLAQALQGQTDELQDRNLPAFREGTVTSTKISIRIQVCLLLCPLHFDKPLQ